jgi:CheY-like chemotaxis protein/predicted Ser/Thr protein kinase
MAEGDPFPIVDGRYSVESTLGQGAMGVVYLARDTGLDRLVALKVIAADLASDTATAARFQKEAQSLATLRNDHIVQVYAYGVHEGACFFAMEYVPGRDLDHIIMEHKKHDAQVPLYRALTILRHVATGLSAVHTKGLVHRDVKPGNIVIEESTGRPVLVDFGLAGGARPANGKETFTGGTPLYMAPEQMDVDRPITPRADQYALACSAFELFTGTTPFDHPDVMVILKRHAQDPPPPLSRFRPDLAVLDGVFNRALSKRPEDRFDSCPAFVSAVEKAIGASPLAMPAVMRSVPPPAALRDSVADAVRVLIVDPDPVFQARARRAVETALPSAIVATAATGSEAVKVTAGRGPQLLLLDVDMLGLDGVETLSCLRELPGGDQLRVVGLSGHVGLNEQWRFSVLGVTDFGEKAISEQALTHLIAEVGARAGWIGADVLQETRLTSGARRTPSSSLRTVPGNATFVRRPLVRRTALGVLVGIAVVAGVSGVVVFASDTKRGSDPRSDPEATHPTTLAAAPPSAARVEPPPLAIPPPPATSASVTRSSSPPRPRPLAGGTPKVGAPDAGVAAPAKQPSVGDFSEFGQRK